MLREASGWIAPTQHALRPFRLHVPTTPAEAAAAYASEEPGSAAYLAGGTDLFAQFREGFSPSSIIWLRRVEALRAIGHDERGLTIGAGVDHHAGSTHPLLTSLLPGLAEGWGRIANVRIRFRATIGGNLMARRHRYEMAIMLDALGARLRFTTARGTVESSVAALRDGPVPGGGLLTEVVVPEPERVRFGYDRTLRPGMTLAVALRQERNGLAGRLSVGSEYRPPATVDFDVAGDRGLTEVAEEAAGRLPDTIGDLAASAKYRRQVSGVLLRRRLTRLIDGSS